MTQLLGAILPDRRVGSASLIQSREACRIEPKTTANLYEEKKELLTEGILAHFQY
jgi:hypothetical protein